MGHLLKPLRTSGCPAPVLAGKTAGPVRGKKRRPRRPAPPLVSSCSDFGIDLLSNLPLPYCLSILSKTQIPARSSPEPSRPCRTKAKLWAKHEAWGVLAPSNLICPISCLRPQVALLVCESVPCILKPPCWHLTAECLPQPLVCSEASVLSWKSCRECHPSEPPLSDRANDCPFLLRYLDEASFITGGLLRGNYLFSHLITQEAPRSIRLCCHRA